MNTMNHFLAALLGAAVIVSLTACASSSAPGAAGTQAVSSSGVQSEAEKQPDSTVAGGWEYNQGELSLEKHAEAKAAFEKAIAGLTGCEYSPIALIGSQVVAGTNYLLICRTTPVCPDAESTFSLVTVYEDPDGNAELADVADLAI